MKKLILAIFILFTVIISANEKILITSDSQMLTDFETIVPLMENEKPNAVFHAGDCVQSGNNESEWQEFLDINANLMKMTNGQYYAAMGNHENRAKKFYEIFPKANKKAYYSIETEDIYLIILNSNIFVKKQRQEEMIWAESELKKAEESGKFIALMFHHPVNSFFSSAKKYLKNDIKSLTDKYRVDFVIQGHEHNYEKMIVDNTVYLVVGGFPQNDITDDDLYRITTREKTTFKTKPTMNKDIKKLVFTNGLELTKVKNYIRLNTSKDILKFEVIEDGGTMIDSFEIKKENLSTDI